MLADSWLRAGCLGAIAVLWAAGALAPYLYVTLLADSSVLSAWGSAGESTLLSGLAGVLVAPLGIGTLLELDAASFAFLGIAAWRLQPASPAAEKEPASGTATESGFRQLRRLGLVSLTALTWVFFFLYSPVEDALPVFAAHHGRRRPGLAGWHAADPTAVAGRDRVDGGAAVH